MKSSCNPISSNNQWFDLLLSHHSIQYWKKYLHICWFELVNQFVNIIIPISQCLQQVECACCKYIVNKFKIIIASLYVWWCFYWMHVHWKAFSDFIRWHKEQVILTFSEEIFSCTTFNKQTIVVQYFFYYSNYFLK